MEVNGIRPGFVRKDSHKMYLLKLIAMKFRDWVGPFFSLPATLIIAQFWYVCIQLFVLT